MTQGDWIIILFIFVLHVTFNMICVVTDIQSHFSREYHRNSVRTIKTSSPCFILFTGAEYRSPHWIRLDLNVVLTAKVILTTFISQGEWTDVSVYIFSTIISWIPFYIYSDISLTMQWISSCVLAISLVIAISHLSSDKGVDVPNKLYTYSMWGSSSVLAVYVIYQIDRKMIELSLFGAVTHQYYQINLTLYSA